MIFSINTNRTRLMMNGAWVLLQDRIKDTEYYIAARELKAAGIHVGHDQKVIVEILPTTLVRMSESGIPAISNAGIRKPIGPPPSMWK